MTRRMHCTSISQTPQMKQQPERSCICLSYLCGFWRSALRHPIHIIEQSMAVEREQVMAAAFLASLLMVLPLCLHAQEPQHPDDSGKPPAPAPARPPSQESEPTPLPYPRPPADKNCIPIICGDKTFMMGFYVQDVYVPVPGAMVTNAPLMRVPPETGYNFRFGYADVFHNKLTCFQDYKSTECGRLQGFYVVTSMNGTQATIDMSLSFAEHGYDGYLKAVGCIDFTRNINQFIIVGGGGSFKAAIGYFHMYRVERYGPGLANSIHYGYVKYKIYSSV